MANETVISLPYLFEPWPHQGEVFVAFYDHGIRRFCEVNHRRSGKDKMALNLTICEMLQRVGNYCHVFPQRQRARLIVWEGIDAQGRRYIDHFPPELVHRKVEQEMMISLKHPEDETKEGSIYRCLGSDRDIYLLVGSNPVGVVWSEYPEINPRMRELVLPIIRRNRGWEILVYTPRGRNHGYRIYQQVKDDPTWHTSFLTIDETCDLDGVPLVTTADVEADLAAGMRYETAQQEYYLSWDVPMPGAVYATEMHAMEQEGRIGVVPYDPSVPVATGWDIGPANTAIWFFQQVGGNIHFIDYEEGSGSLPHWIEVCRAKPYVYDHAALNPPLTRHVYEVHYGPWDLEQEDYGTKKSRYGIALEHRLRFSVLPKGRLEDRIETMRKLLPLARIDEGNCAAGIDALRSYRYQWDEHKLTYSRVPVHDWATHGADAGGYVAVGLLPPPRPPVEKPPPGSFDHMRQLAINAQKGRPTRRASYKAFD